MAHPRASLLPRLGTSPLASTQAFVDEIHLQLGDQLMVFGRAHPHDVWLVDPWSRGALLPPSAGRAALQHLGVPAAEHEGWMAAIPPRRVWARMLRNLQSREAPGSAEASFWEDVACGLDALGTDQGP